MQPRVSVIIPCFNTSRFVGEAIQSALDQTYPNIEVVVIDDGSTDGSVEVLKSFGDRIRWETGPNRGACSARNRGFELSQGEFIQFLDADDLLHTNKLERQLPVAMEREDTLIFCDADCIGSLHPHLVRRDATDDPVIFMLLGGLPTPAPLHRRTWLERVGGFRVDLPCSQERDLHLRLAATGLRFQRLSETLYTVRRQAEGVSSNTLRVLDQHSRILWPVYNDLKERGKLTEQRKREFAGLLARDARTYLRLGRREQAQQYFQEARQMHPEGGLSDAYGPWARGLCQVFGPRFVESVGALARSIRRREAISR